MIGYCYLSAALAILAALWIADMGRPPTLRQMRSWPVLEAPR